MSTITFRANKNEALTYSEMDKNFGSFLYSSSLSGNGQQIVLHYTSSVNVPIDSGSVSYSLIAGLQNAGADRRIAHFSGSSVIVTQEGFVVDENGSVGIKVNENALPLTYDLEVSGSIRATGTILQSSDARLKENIQSINNPVEKIKLIEGVSYNFINSPESKLGVIAQQIQKILPEVVSEDKKGYLNVDYSGLIPVLVEAFKEQINKIEQLEERIAQLENK